LGASGRGKSPRGDKLGDKEISVPFVPVITVACRVLERSGRVFLQLTVFLEFVYREYDP
jgi:hypothetical protein